MSRIRIHDAAGEREFELSRDTVTIGLSPDCDVDLADVAASPEHCEILREGSGWKLVDLESRDGTRVNGSYVNQAVLADGDVIEIGSTKIEFVGGAVAAAPPPPAPVAAAPPPPPAAAAPPPARSSAREALQRRAAAPRSVGGGAGSGRRRARDVPADDEYEEQRPRRPRRSQSNSGLTVILIVAAVIGFLGLGAMLLTDSGSPNQRIWRLVDEADRRGDPQAVIEAARGAEPADDAYYPRIMEKLEDAKRSVAADVGDDRTKAAIDAWNDIVQWEYRHRDDEAGMVARIDAFLAEYGELKGAAVAAAQRKRVELTGSPTAGAPANVSAAWQATQTMIAAYRKKGRFGEAIQAVERFRRDHGSKGDVSPSDINETIATLEAQAKSWFASQVSLAEQKIDQNNFFEARKIMERASRRMQMPEYEERAMEELNRLRKKQQDG